MLTSSEEEKTELLIIWKSSRKYMKYIKVFKKIYEKKIKINFRIYI